MSEPILSGVSCEKCGTMHCLRRGPERPLLRPTSYEHIGYVARVDWPEMPSLNGSRGVIMSVSGTLALVALGEGILNNSPCHVPLVNLVLQTGYMVYEDL